MASRTGMLRLVRALRWSDVRTGLEESPALLGWRDGKGRSWLHLACSVGPQTWRRSPADSVRLADVLLDAGLDIDEPAFREGAWKATPLWHAVARGRNRTLARHLLRRGADPDHCLWAAAYQDDVAAIELLVGAGAEIDPVTEDETPFLHAVKTRRFRAAEALLAFGANVDFQDGDGRTALHHLLRRAGDARPARMLIRHGARGDLPDRDGATAQEAMARKRAPGWRRLAAQLAGRRARATPAPGLIRSVRRRRARGCRCGARPGSP